jgi:hypothetical protein
MSFCTEISLILLTLLSTYLCSVKYIVLTFVALLFCLELSRVKDINTLTALFS